MSSPPVVVVGGGISGCVAALELFKAGIPVRLIDRGKRVGGRMAVRTLRDTGTRWDGRPVDIGAAFFTVRDADFADQVTQWQQQGMAEQWTDMLAVADAEGLQGTTSGVMRWSAGAGLRSLVDHLAAQLPAGTVEVARTVERVSIHDGVVHVDDEPATLALLCAPDPQVKRMLSDQPEFDAVHAEISTSQWQPVLALTAVYERRVWPEITGVFVNGSDVLSFVADDGTRRGDGAAVIVAHSASALAAAHLDDPSAAAPIMLSALHQLLGMSEQPRFTHVQRWSLARPTEGRHAPHLFDPRLGVGVAGDAWHGGPRIEAAWLSGASLGRAAVAELLTR